MLLIVMFEAGTWRVRPEEQFTFGRAKTCYAGAARTTTAASPQRRQLRVARADSWWLANASASSMLYLPGTGASAPTSRRAWRCPLQQWHAKVRLDGMLDSYTLRMRLPRPGRRGPDDDAETSRAPCRTR